MSTIKTALSAAMTARKSERAAAKADRVSTASRDRMRKTRSNVRVNADAYAADALRFIQRHNAQVRAREPDWARVVMPLEILLHPKEKTMYQQCLKAYTEAGACAAFAKSALTVELNAATHRGDLVAFKRISRAIEKTEDFATSFSDSADYYAANLGDAEARNRWCVRNGFKPTPIKTREQITRDAVAAVASGTRRRTRAKAA